MRILRHCCFFTLFWGGLLYPAGARTETIKPVRKHLASNSQKIVKAFSGRKLILGPPKGWVDSGRWAAAQARLISGEKLETSNQYFETIQWCSSRNGLIQDTDIQITDLLKTYLEFKDSPQLSAKAKSHLLQMFKTWEVPNHDRNRNADTYYQWPGEYTENHSFNILVAAYLIDSTLARDRKLRRTLLKDFFYDRARWGWSEFHAPGYSLITNKALTLLAKFSPDPEIATLAKMHLDILFWEFACQAIGQGWRGVPFARGYGMQKNNQENMFSQLWQFYFTDIPEKTVKRLSPFLLHFCDSDYFPPKHCQDLVSDCQARGTFDFWQTATHGPAKLRIPLKIRITPRFSISSVQGYSCYYDPCYWSISFSASPQRVITSQFRHKSNAFQLENILITFGNVNFYGQFTMANIDKDTVFFEEENCLGIHQKLTGNCHLLMIQDKKHTDKDALLKTLADLNLEVAAGIISWQMPDQRKVRLINEHQGDFWKLKNVLINDREQRLDNNMLYDCPYMRGERDSAIITLHWKGLSQVYDFRDRNNPSITLKKEAKLPEIPLNELTGPLGIVFKRIPAGEFCKGSPASEGRANERPQHWTYLDEFYISETELTVEHYRQFLKAHPGLSPISETLKQVENYGDNYPIVNITWFEAKAFCEWLSQIDKDSEYQLPTETQWEKAAKGYYHRAYPWGSEYDGTQAGSKNGIYLPVKSKPADRSLFGVYDMAGNIWEWCANSYEEDSCRPQESKNPHGPSQGEMKVLRGCGWNYDPDTFRCSYRSAAKPDLKSFHIGFRIIRIKKTVADSDQRRR